MRVGLFTSFTGRITRSQWWLGTLMIFLTQFVFGFIIGMGIGLGGGNMTPAATIFINAIAGIIIFIPSLAISVKRWHDLNYSGWFGVITFAVALVATTINGYLVEHPNDVFLTVLLILSGLYGLWAFILLGCTRGTLQGNRYGLDPLITTEVV